MRRTLRRRDDHGRRHEKAKSADPAKYLPELAKISYKGVTGHDRIRRKGDIKDGTLTLYTYKDGNKEKIAVVQ